MALGEVAFMASKFRGCMLGSLLGDCIGAPFEGEAFVNKADLQEYFNDLSQLEHNEDPHKPQKFLPYTDDTAMTKSIAKSLLSEQGFGVVNMAQRFVKEYFKQPRRGYGGNVIQVFKKLRDTNFADVFAPAREQFGGLGSYGNGGAMRVAPVALYYHGHKDGQQVMLDVARQATQITHTHRDACNGAILQCMAVSQCLNLDPRQEPLDENAFLDGLLTKMERVEKDGERLGLETPTPYQDALHRAKKLLSNPEVEDTQVVEGLGNDISALGSVPTAVYCFLRAQQNTQITGIEAENRYQRTIQYAISLGGDTDTIACMAGAMAGAYLGSDLINVNYVKRCEAAQKMSLLGEQIYKAKL